MRISQLPLNNRNMNSCQEWGQPRVPVLAVTGGDRVGPWAADGVGNPRKDWTAEVLEKIETGSMKRIRYWAYEPPPGPHGLPPHSALPSGQFCPTNFFF